MGHPICHTSPLQNSTFKVQSSTFSAASFTNQSSRSTPFPPSKFNSNVRCSKFIPLATPSPQRLPNLPPALMTFRPATFRPSDSSLPHFSPIFRKFSLPSPPSRCFLHRNLSVRRSPVAGNPTPAVPQRPQSLDNETKYLTSKTNPLNQKPQIPNPVMKTKLFTLLAAAAACGLAGAETTTAYTTPVGYTTLTLKPGVLH